MATEKDKSKQKEVIRDSITDLFEDSGIDVNSDIDSQTLVFKKTPSTITSYEVDVLTKCKERAEKVMTTLLRLYLSEGFISKSEFIQAKVNMDSMTLGKIMNQMEVSERAINILMENIEMGDVNPKLFDALGNLQRTFIDLVKTQTNYIMSVENEYEKLALDKDSTIEVTESTATEISNGYKSANQKDLMRIIRSTISDKK
ncbi:MAG: hypothetical protein NC548_21310 [Lachnospiraceae bacterium]|nr:hypothetical protein [Lachnospiraceae bacterium]